MFNECVRFNVDYWSSVHLRLSDMFIEAWCFDVRLRLTLISPILRQLCSSWYRPIINVGVMAKS